MVYNSVTGRYRFPDQYRMNVGNVDYNLSEVEVDLCEIRKGGIGRISSATQLLANGMRMLGEGNGVYNLLFCVEKRNSPFAILNHEDAYCEIIQVKNSISKALDNRYNFINLPLDIDGHATLASLLIKDGSVSIKFYDSLSDAIVNYSERYSTELIEFIQRLLPEGILLERNHEVLHLADQGGENSSGCGYFTIYTAGLLVERKDLREYSGQPLLFSSDDEKIRAELAVRSLLWHGLKNAENDLYRLRYFGDMKHVCHKLQFSALDTLIKDIYVKNEELFSSAIPTEKL